MIDPEQALAAAHADARLQIEAAKTVLRMAIMFPERMSHREACERALDELSQVPQVAILLREVPVEVPYAALPKSTIAVRGLSAQQSKILNLVAEGYSNKEIADMLFLSSMTVKSHLARVYKALGVNNRTSAALKAVELRNGSNPGTH